MLNSVYIYLRNVSKMRNATTQTTKFPTRMALLFIFSSVHPYIVLENSTLTMDEEITVSQNRK